MNDFSKKIIIIGVTHHNTLTMVRCLGKVGYGIQLYIYGDKNTYIQYSKYVTVFTNKNTCEEVFDDLFIKKNKWGYKPIVISCSDEVSHLFDLNYDELKDSYFFFNCGEKGRLTYYMDKQKQVQLASKLGIIAPKSKVKKNGVDTIKFDNFPCICKPLSSINGKKSQICVCFDQKSLDKVLNSFGQQSCVQVQEFIKREFEMVVIGLRVNGETIIPGFIKKLRDRLGGTTYAKIYPIDKFPTSIVISIKKFIEEINYEGLFGIELIYTKGKYYFVEANLRNDATTFAFSVAGVNLPLAYVLAKSGKNFHVETSKMLHEINSMVELADITHVMKFKISLFRWLKERNRCESLYFYDKDDMKPYKVAKKQFVMGYINRALNKLHFK